jgi:outer membrane protein OmpA-like peptidoglycan-associated protein
MKKVLMMFAAALLTATASAQNTAVTANKFSDNWYLGINGGITSTSTYAGDKATKFKGLAPNFGIRLGKNLTTVFGLALEGNAYFKANEKSVLNSKTFINATVVNLLGTFNLSNLFGGYQGEPRTVELIALGGFGWGHQFGQPLKVNNVTSKVALDLAFNLGEDKAWQLYVEPAIIYGMEGYLNGQSLSNGFKYNFQNAMLQANVGLVYKFGNSNGTHNYAIEPLRNINEINMLNAKINELRADNELKDGKLVANSRTIADLQAEVDDLRAKLTACENQPHTSTVVVKKSLLQPIVIFGQGKSTIDAAQYASVEMVAKYMRNHPDAKLLIKGYASPEGDPERNMALSLARADAVRQALINRYKIAASRITTEGMGATSELSEENDFNRVAMFFDTTME